MSTTPSNKNFIRRPQIDSTAVALDDPEQRVDLQQGVDTGIALVGNTAGIETEAPTRMVAQALSDEKFLAEKVEVQFHDPATENDHQFVEGGVNGDKFCFPRNSGQTFMVKRYHLEQVAGARVQRLTQRKITLPDGTMGYEERAVLQPLYPFSVISDPNPRGSAWLRQLLQRS